MAKPLRCSFCHSDLGGDVAICPGCGSQAHDDCRAELAECPTLGCPVKGVDTAPPAALESDDDDVPDHVGSPQAAELVVGVLATLCLAYGVLGLGSTAISAWRWAEVAARPAALQRHWQVVYEQILVGQGALLALARIGCGVAFVRRGPRARGLVLVLAQVMLVTAVAATGAKMAVAARVVARTRLMVGAPIYGLELAVLPIVLTIVVLRDDVTRFLAGTSAPEHESLGGDAPSAHE